MDMTKLKQLESRVQIINLIEKATLFGGDIWQTQPEDHERHLSQIIQIQLDMKQDKIVFRTPSVVGVDPYRPIFIRLAYRNLIFRMSPGQFKVNGDKITCNYPADGRALEERKNDRYVLPFNANISLSMKRIERTMRETTYDMELRVIDVSEKGFGILISGQNRDYLRKGDHFWLKSVDHRTLRHHILGTVCYVAPKGYYLKRGDVRVGLSLNAPLNQEMFAYLKKQCLMVLSA